MDTEPTIRLFLVSLVMSCPNGDEDEDDNWDEETETSPRFDGDVWPVAIVKGTSNVDASVRAKAKLMNASDFDASLLQDCDHSEYSTSLIAEELDRKWFSREGIDPLSKEGFDAYLLALNED